MERLRDQAGARQGRAQPSVLLGRRVAVLGGPGGMVVGMGGCVQKARKLHVHTGRRESLLRVNSLEKSCPLSSSKRRAPLGCGLSGGRRPIRSRRALGGT